MGIPGQKGNIGPAGPRGKPGPIGVLPQVGTRVMQLLKSSHIDDNMISFTRILTLKDLILSTQSSVMPSAGVPRRQISYNIGAGVVQHIRHD